MLPLNLCIHISLTHIFLTHRSCSHCSWKPDCLGVVELGAECRDGFPAAFSSSVLERFSRMARFSQMLLGRAARLFLVLHLSAWAFVFAVIVRWTLAVKTLLGLIVLIFICLTGLVVSWYVPYSYVVACIRAHNRIHEFEDLNLSQSEAQEDVEAWWKQNAKIDGTLQDCLDALAGLLIDQDEKHTLVISLNGISKQQVALHYHKLRAESLGITLLASELYNLSLQ